jgi:GntR family transcriptional regulator of abcA and norABC
MTRKDPFLSRSQSIAIKIREMIVSTALVAGEQLPAMRNMTKMFSAGSDVIEGALDILRAEGIVHTKPRYGTFITGEAWRIIKTPNWDEKIKISGYNPTNKNLQDMLSQFEQTDNVPNISMPSVSDGIYAELFKHLNEKLYKIMKSSESLEKYRNTGLPEFKDNISKYMKTYGIDIDPRQIIICAHVQDAVSMLAHLLARPGVTVLYETPGINYQYIHSLGADMCALDMDRDGVDERQFLRHISERKNAVFFTHPLYSFPTGITTSLWRKKRIFNYCLNANVPIIEIDDYRCFDFDAPETYYSLSGGNVIHVGSLTRAFPFGVPISWLVLPFRLVKVISDIKYQLNWGPDIYIQMLVNETLKDGSFFDYLAKLKNYIEVRNAFTRKLIDEHLNGYIETMEDKHPFAYWCKLHVKTDALIKQSKDINMAVGNMFSNECSHHIVISKTHPSMPNYEAAILLLKEALRKTEAASTKKSPLNT